MEINDLKLYSVIVGEGSGVLFQPMNNLEYTYVLTANHNFFIKDDDDRGQKIERLKENIEVSIINENGGNPIPIDVKEGENYFPHKNADIAILKIKYIVGFHKIIVSDDLSELANYGIYGYPGYYREKETLSEKFSKIVLDSFISENDFTCRAQLKNPNEEQAKIIGFSGGGILQLENDFISLIGIQIEVASHIPNGQIEFVPIKFFKDIVNYPENYGKLAPLLPPYMADFNILKNEILKLEEAIDPNFRIKIKNAFETQLPLIDVSPIDIYKSKLKKHLLANDESNTALLSEEMWKSWFEYLLVLCVLRGGNINLKNLESIFNEKRLIHSDTKDSWIQIIPKILSADLDGFKQNGILIVSTKKSPLSKRRLNNGIVKSIVDTRSDELKMNIDQASKITAVKEIIHVKAFEIDCILENQNSLNRHSTFEINELINDLKTKFYEFFEN